MGGADNSGWDPQPYSPSLCPAPVLSSALSSPALLSPDPPPKRCPSGSSKFHLWAFNLIFICLIAFFILNSLLFITLGSTNKKRRLWSTSGNGLNDLLRHFFFNNWVDVDWSIPKSVLHEEDPPVTQRILPETGSMAEGMDPYFSYYRCVYSKHYNKIKQLNINVE